jgi:hypothetical protein
VGLDVALGDSGGEGASSAAGGVSGTADSFSSSSSFTILRTEALCAALLIELSALMAATRDEGPALVTQLLLEVAVLAALLSTEHIAQVCLLLSVCRPHCAQPSLADSLC